MVKTGLLLFLMFSWQAGASTDLQLMEKARAQYAKDQLPQAVEIYSQIPASSDFWLDALEERAWARTKQGDFEAALADLQSITSSVWSSQVGPETYMLSTFVSLKICAYKDVVQKIALFKQRLLPRVDALQALLSKPLPVEFQSLSEDILKGRLSMASLGKNAENYPRYFYRDQKLYQALKEGRKEAAEIRLRQLAQADLDEISQNLKKMKIIEVELIQKVLMSDDLKRPQNKNLKFAGVDRNQQLIFPVTDDEVWVDEVGHFQVKAEKCPFNSRRQ